MPRGSSARSPGLARPWPTSRSATSPEPGVVFQIGVPPGRIDVLTELTGLAFDEAWPGREAGWFGDMTVDFLEVTEAAARSRAKGPR